MAEKKVKEFTLVLTGKSGAGKTTLFKNIFGAKDENVLTTDPSTDTPECEWTEKNGVRIRVVDTPGLIYNLDPDKSLSEIKKKMKEKLDISDFDLLVYCIPVRRGEQFAGEDGHNRRIMKSLQDFHGADIWKHCVVVFTFSNLRMFGIKIENRSQEESKIEEIYKAEIEGIMKEFRAELKNLKVDTEVLRPATIFTWAGGGRGELKNTILGIPAGKVPEDQVLPGIEQTNDQGWIDELMLEMINKCQTKEKKEAIAQAHYGKNVPLRVAGAIGVGAAGATLGVSAGAAIGFSVGAIGGPIGMAVGAGAGAVVGLVAGGLAAWLA